MAKRAKIKCEAKTNFCSGELVAEYGVNGSKKEGKTFKICGACAVIFRRSGHKLVQS